MDVLRSTECDVSSGRFRPLLLCRLFRHGVVRRWSFPILAILGLIVTPPAPGLASRNSDVHSNNMHLLANLDIGVGGDIAFWGNLAIVGHGFNEPSGGFRVVDISDPTNPTLRGEFSCASSGYDVSVWRDLVILSSDVHVRAKEPAGDPAACDAAPVGLGTEEFSGLRIVSIADPAKPRLIVSVKKEGLELGKPGSHTHTLVPDLQHKKDGVADPRLLVYLNAPAGGQQIVEVPLRDPSAASVLGFIDTAPARGCHDTTVYFSAGRPLLAACAAVTETQIWDISKPAGQEGSPEHPKVLSRIRNPQLESHHSTAFSWDGEMLLIGDESAAAHTTCFATTAGVEKTGHLWFYSIEDDPKNPEDGPGNPHLKWDFQIPGGRAAGPCFVHQFNVVPLTSGRDVVVASWVQGGTTVLDFTDRQRAPQEIGYYLADPTGARSSSAFASYWYNGYIYASNVPVPGSSVDARGFDVLSIQHTELADFIKQDHMNAQTQRGGT